MQIGIFETEHFEGAYPVIKLFDNGQNQLTIFTYESSFRQFQYLFKDSLTNYTWVIKKSTESKYQFIYRIYKITKETRIDILYLNTISNNHIVYALMIAALRKVRIITTLHDINGYFTMKPAFSSRRWIRYLGKRCLIKLVKEFNVVSSTMVDYLRNKLPAYKKVHCIPGSVFEETSRPNTAKTISKPIKIVIPGTVDTRRRNYDFIFDVLDKVNQRNLEVHFILLGGAHQVWGKSVVDKCNQFLLKNSNLQYFESEVVDQPVFDRELDEAHFIFIPSVINTIISDGVREVYGLSISSGNIFDVIKHAKPFLIPVQLAIPRDLETSCFRYSSAEDLVTFLQSFLEHPGRYVGWKEKALQNSRSFTIEKIRNNNPSLFLQQITSTR